MTILISAVIGLVVGAIIGVLGTVVVLALIIRKDLSVNNKRWLGL